MLAAQASQAACTACAATGQVSGCFILVRAALESPCWIYIHRSGWLVAPSHSSGQARSQNNASAAGATCGHGMAVANASRGKVGTRAAEQRRHARGAWRLRVYGPERQIGARGLDGTTSGGTAALGSAAAACQKRCCASAARSLLKPRPWAPAAPRHSPARLRGQGSSGTEHAQGCGPQHCHSLLQWQPQRQPK